MSFLELEVSFIIRWDKFNLDGPDDGPEYFSGIGLTRIHHRTLSQGDSMEQAESWYGVHFRTGELWSCKLCRGAKTQLDASAC